MSRFLHRVGGSAARHPWRTIGAWVVIVIAMTGLAGTVGGAAGRLDVLRHLAAEGDLVARVLDRPAGLLEGDQPLVTGEVGDRDVVLHRDDRRLPVGAEHGR